MKGAIVVCFLAVAAVALARPGPDEEKYPTKYDSINLDEIFNNRRLLDAYIKCILDLGKCTAEGTALKTRVTDGLQTHCSKCSEIQLNGSKTVINFLANKRPDDWQKIKQKYDPTGQFSAEYEKERK